VTEEALAEPSTETGQVLRATERLVLEGNGIVARVAGIYGPGRGVLFQKFCRGEAVIEGDGQRWMNQVHRDDVVQALLVLAERGGRGEIYHVVDDEPCPYLSYYEWLAQTMQRVLPPFGPVNLERKRGLGDKRVDNGKLKALGWVLSYPTFREGLLAEIRAGEPQTS
jgi:nucleoside-diphosphate-sugar epimerase